MELWQSLLHRGLDFEGDILRHPEYLENAYEAGKSLVNALNDNKDTPEHHIS